MINKIGIIYFLYNLSEKTPIIIRKLIPNFIKKKYVKKILKFYFLHCKEKNLPSLNYVNEGNDEYQNNLIKKFIKTQKRHSFVTSPNLIQLLLTKFKNSDEFSFLDFGGENIDFYLEINKNFKNVKYFLFNLDSINETFKRIKNKFNFNNLIVINNLEEIYNNRFTFVNFGSSIQYIDKYEEVLDKITDNSKFIYFSATHLYNSSNKIYSHKIVVKQVNDYPKIHYLYFFNDERFYEIFKKKNFQLIFEKNNPTDQVNYDNFKNELNNIRYCDFLFQKIQI
tara:strand:+ start:196 stop:1038 length:843 start_codon:yes stop_codon:yes gene_type:complete